MPILARFTAVNLLPHEHIEKMVVFFEKHPVTSSNCYETMKNASILMKLATNVDWKIISLTACSILNFLLPRQLGYFSKLRKITILLFFPCTGLNFLLPWQRGGHTITVYCEDLLQFLPFLLKLTDLAISFISYYSK
jgi:hypothetical protein